MDGRETLQRLAAFKHGFEIEGTVLGVGALCLGVSRIDALAGKARLMGIEATTALALMGGLGLAMGALLSWNWLSTRGDQKRMRHLLDHRGEMQGYQTRPDSADAAKVNFTIQYAGGRTDRFSTRSYDAKFICEWLDDGVSADL